MKKLISIALIILIYACSNENQKISISKNIIVEDGFDLESDAISTQTNDIIDDSINLDSHKLLITTAENINKEELIDENFDGDFMMTIDSLLSYYGCPSHELFNYLGKINHKIIDYHTLELNSKDTNYYLNGKLYNGIVKLIDQEYGDQYYTLYRGRLNGPYYQLIDAEGGGKMFGYYKNGMRHGIFKNIFWDLDCAPYSGIEYNMGEIISLNYVDDVGRYTKTTVVNGIAVKCVTNENEMGKQTDCNNFKPYPINKTVKLYL